MQPKVLDVSAVSYCSDPNQLMGAAVACFFGLEKVQLCTE